MYETDFLAWVYEAGINNLIWCTDLDHTVLDMVHDSSQVMAAPGLENTFYELDAKTEGRFYVITGREMGYVDRIFPNGLLKASTEYHNVMRWDNNGEAEELTHKPQWNLIDARIQMLIDQYWPEDYKIRDKPYMRSLHIQAAPAFVDEGYKSHVKNEIQTILDDYFSQTGQKLINIDGGHVFDIAPEGSSKGKAIEDIIAECRINFPNRALKPIYFGDSPGDLPAAEAVQNAGGKFIAVGNDERLTRIADFRVHTPSLCRALFSNTARFMPKAPAFSIPDLGAEPVSP